MDKDELSSLLEKVQEGKLSVGEAREKLKHLPYTGLESIKIDHHRELRRGFPEVIFCLDKSPEQALDAFQELAKHSGQVLATRVSREAAQLIKDYFPEACYNREAKILYLRTRTREVGGRIGVLTAGSSDLPIAEEAALTAELLGNQVERIYDVGIAGLHRLLPHLETLGKCQALIVIAGMEGALPGVVAGMVDKPVIAVPTSIGYGAHLGGLAALLTMINSCVPGIGVVNIDNGFGAAVLAYLISKSSG